MASDAEVLERVHVAFATVARPEHFTDHQHCCECAEHDEVLRSRDLQTLQIADVGNAAWDPMCFATDEGFLFYLPALARLALDEPEPGQDWYVPQFLFHLTYQDGENRRLRACSEEQRAAIRLLLEHVRDTRTSILHSYAAGTDLQRAIELWAV